MIWIAVRSVDLKLAGVLTPGSRPLADPVA